MQKKAPTELRKYILKKFKDEFKTKIAEKNLNIGESIFSYSKWEQNIPIKQWEDKEIPFFISLWIYEQPYKLNGVYVRINKNSNYGLIKNKKCEEVLKELELDGNTINLNQYWDYIDNDELVVKPKNDIFEFKDFISEIVDGAIKITEKLHRKLKKHGLVD